MTETPAPDTDAPAIRWDRDPGDIVTLTLDEPGRSANTLTPAYVAAMTAVLQRLGDERGTVSGVILTSAKKTFFAGGDLNELLTFRPDDAADLTAHVMAVKNQLRTLETIGIPVVAAINGAALGGGLELALATHHRIIADVRGAVVGLPEVGLGLLPGLGGIVRTVRMLGITRALQEVLLTGRRFRPEQAHELGLVDEIVDSIEDLVPAAQRWIATGPDPVQPWDRDGFRIPGGTPSTPATAALLPALPATLRRQLHGAPMPAPRAIVAAVVEGAQVDLENAALIETRYFVGLVTGPVAKNMIRSTFFDLQAVNAGAGRPAGVAPRTITGVGVLGAGMMGAGIAQVCAAAGIDVVLEDVDLPTAGRGVDQVRRALDRAVGKGGRTREAADATLARITPTDDPAALAGVELVIEAVFESAELKQQVFGEIQDVIGEGAVLASNTSTLPISGLAAGVRRPQNFIGIHFLSPVEKMLLVEIIVGDRTSDETIAIAFDLARQLGKTPIVVNDGRGFFTSRVIMAFLREAIAAVGEGVEPASIEQAGLQAGYPAGPLQLLDELTLTLPRSVRRETLAALADEGRPSPTHPSDAVLDRLIDECGRAGRSSGAGFYDYTDGARGLLWPGLRETFDAGRSRPPLVDLQERMLFAEAIEAVRCLDEGVLRSVADANVGSLLGIGFPAWTGGVLQYVNSYRGGPAGFVERAHGLAEQYGAHLRPPESLVALAAAGGEYS